MKAILRQGPLGPLRRPACQRVRSTASGLWPVDRPVHAWHVQYTVNAGPPGRGFASSTTLHQQEQISDKRYAPPPHRSSINRLTVISTKASKLTVVEIDGQQVTFDNVFLRDACACPQCIDPSTQQKLFQTSDIPYDIKPRIIMPMDDGTLSITWESGLPPHDKAGHHESFYEIGFLRRYADMRWRLRHSFNDRRQVLWDKRLMMQDILWINYSDYMNSDLKLFEAVRQLSLYGLLLLHGVPENQEQNAVEGIAQRIGNIKNTFYGKTWDVRSIKDAKNIAYTPLYLGLHMDLLYFESPPGVQFLHCIRNNAMGGASIFADSFRAVQAVRMSSESLFHSLCRFPVTFHYKNDGHHYHYTRPTVVLDNNTYLRQPRIDHVNWAPPFQAPIEADTSGQNNSEFRRWICAIQNIGASLDDPDSQLELRLKEGECAVFMNRRVVHGRREFDPASGDRWLKGTYVDVDAFLSKFRTLSERFKGLNKEGKDSVS